MDQFVLGNETPGVLGEIAQDIEGLGPKLNLIVPAHQRAGLQIKRVMVEAKPLGRDGAHPSDLSRCLWSMILPLSPAFRRYFVALSLRIGPGALFICKEPGGTATDTGVLRERMNWRTAALVVLSALLAAGEAAAQTDYPTRTVRLIVGFGPGTSPDIVARIVGDRLFHVWSKPVVIENVTGAAGNIAGERVARAEPDGYTLQLAVNSGIAINPNLYRMSYDPVRDLVPISQVCSYANILA